MENFLNCYKQFKNEKRKYFFKGCILSNMSSEKATTEVFDPKKYIITTFPDPRSLESEFLRTLSISQIADFDAVTQEWNARNPPCEFSIDELLALSQGLYYV